MQNETFFQDMPDINRRFNECPGTGSVVGQRRIAREFRTCTRTEPDSGYWQFGGGLRNVATSQRFADRRIIRNWEDGMPIAVDRNIPGGRFSAAGSPKSCVCSANWTIMIT